MANKLILHYSRVKDKEAKQFSQRDCKVIRTFLHQQIIQFKSGCQSLYRIKDQPGGEWAAATYQYYIHAISTCKKLLTHVRHKQRYQRIELERPE